MDSEKEKELLDYLASLGFEGENIAGKIHVQAEKNLPLIVIGQYKFFGEERMRYDLYLRRDPQFDAYRLEKYEATLRNPVPVEHKIINGLDTAVLEQKMKTVDWQQYFRNKNDPAYRPEAIDNIMVDLFGLLNPPVPEGPPAYHKLAFKYWPEEAWDDAVKKLKPAYEQNRSFIAGEYGMANANLAWHIMSGRFDDLFEKFRVLGLEDFPGTEVYPKLEEFLSGNPDDFLFQCSRNQPEGLADFVIAVSKIDDWYQIYSYKAIVTPHPSIEHGRFDNIDTRRLEQQMQQINWHDDRQLFIMHEDREPDFTPAVSDIQEQVYRLSQNMAGADTADKLMLKYWIGTTFFEDMIPQTAWDELKERAVREQQFQVEISARAAYNLLNGRAVLGTARQQIEEESLPWVRLELDQKENNGFYPVTTTEGFNKTELEFQLGMLPFTNSRFYAVRNGLLCGDIVPVTLENGTRLKIEASPEQRTLNIYTPDMRPVPVNLRFDPDWKPAVQQHRQQQKKDHQQFKTAPSPKRRKGKGL